MAHEGSNRASNRAKCAAAHTWGSVQQDTTWRAESQTLKAGGMLQRPLHCLLQALLDLWQTADVFPQHCRQARHIWLKVCSVETGHARNLVKMEVSWAGRAIHNRWQAQPGLFTVAWRRQCGMREVEMNSFSGSWAQAGSLSDTITGCPAVQCQMWI